ncbi:hypothetical protein GWK47_005522 [Chionoecetes opilio]|uniref:Uncharacterized protein n=1 Tax=Chionoecetes opilio TaxID=41210 RepID=A0A8J4YI28_CHIOP|nr:hypothetical protein GWK47_005522 [Chionoecetes opilio]
MCKNLSAASAAGLLGHYQRQVSTGAGLCGVQWRAAPHGLHPPPFGGAFKCPCRFCPTVALDTMPGTSDSLRLKRTLAPPPRSRRDETRRDPPSTAPPPSPKGMRTPPHPDEGRPRRRRKDEARSDPPTPPQVEWRMRPGPQATPGSPRWNPGCGGESQQCHA